jgi:hypothetical protein
MSQEDILRLLVVREPGAHASPWLLDPLEVSDEATELASEVKTLTNQSAKRDAFVAAGKRFRESPGYVRAVKQVPLNVSALPEWVQANAKSTVATIDFGPVAHVLAKGHLELPATNSLQALVAAPQFLDTFRRLFDSVVADSIDKRTRTATTDEHVAGRFSRRTGRGRVSCGSQDYTLPHAAHDPHFPLVARRRRRRPGQGARTLTRPRSGAFLARSRTHGRRKLGRPARPGAVGCALHAAAGD